MFPLDAEFIEETHSEYCVVCKQSKAGRFLIIHLTKAGLQTYLAICGECLDTTLKVA